jgi:hypothetical protein
MSRYSLGGISSLDDFDNFQYLVNSSIVSLNYQETLYPRPVLDILNPTLTASTPADNATSVAKGSNLILTFSESVQAGTGNIILSNGTDIRTIPISDTNQITFSSNLVTINPSTDLQNLLLTIFRWLLA